MSDLKSVARAVMLGLFLLEKVDEAYVRMMERRKDSERPKKSESKAYETLKSAFLDD